MFMFGWDFEVDACVEILKMKFDQDLRQNPWYKLNPRARCAFGNVLLILCTSPGQGDSAWTSTWTPRTRRDGALCTWLALEGEGRLSGCLSKREPMLPWLMAGMDSCRRTQIKMHTSSKSKSEDHQQFIMKCISQGIIQWSTIDWLIEDEQDNRREGGWASTHKRVKAKVWKCRIAYTCTK